MGALIAKYSGVFLLATIKFVFAPTAGWASGLTFWEIYFAALAGGLLSFNVFYLSSNHFMLRAQAKRMEKEQATGLIKKKFTGTNKFVVKMKRSPLGYVLLVLLGPNFLSVPIGSIIVAKFYGDRKQTYWLCMAVLAVSAFAWTALWMFME